MRVLVTGCTGALAQPLAAWLQSAGHDVTGVSRDPTRAAGNGLQVIGWEQLTVRFIQAQRIDAIVNLAGAPMMQRWNARNKAAILGSRLATVRAICALLRELPTRLRPECVVHASSVSIYSSCTLPVDEFSPPRADTRFFQARVWQAVERLIVEPQVPGVRTLIARLGLVIGADALMQRMLTLSRCYLGSVLGDGRQRISWIARHDMLRALTRLLTDMQLQGVFHIVAPRPITAAQLAAGIARSVNRPVPFHAPAPLLRLVLGELAGNFLVSADVMPARLQMAGFDWALPDFDGAIKTAADELGRARTAVAGNAGIAAAAPKRNVSAVPAQSAEGPAGNVSDDISVVTLR